jgi:hypothetical protein
MGMTYNIYKNKEDNTPIISSEKYAGIPDLSSYGLEVYNPECDDCGKEDCFLCDNAEYTTRYKINQEKAEEIINDMLCNVTLFADIMEEIDQGYFWIEEMW